MSAAWLSGNTASMGTFSQPSAMPASTWSTPACHSGEAWSTWPRCRRVKVCDLEDAFADVLEGLALGLADADHVAELPDHVEGAVKHGGAIGIDGEVDALPLREVEHGLLEIFLARHHDPGRAVRQRAF